MRKYGVNFFDWDGTAVLSRTAPTNKVIEAMEPLLQTGTQLVIISGTSYNNIAAGKLAEHFAPKLRSNLYMGLGRGAHNYSYDGDGNVAMLDGITPDRATLAKLHRTCFDLHEHLFEKYGYNTDIVFSRENYCKIDLGPDMDRGEHLFFKSGELERINDRLSEHGYKDGIRGLFDLAETVGKENGIAVKSTTDAKFLEVGFGTKSDNVNTILSHLETKYGVIADDCCFWGDEFLQMGEGIFGSDAFMITEKTKDCDFFDISEAEGTRPPQVQHLGGGVERFLAFLHEQAK